MTSLDGLAERLRTLERDQERLRERIETLAQEARAVRERMQDTEDRAKWRREYWSEIKVWVLFGAGAVMSIYGATTSQGLRRAIQWVVQLLGPAE